MANLSPEDVYSVLSFDYQSTSKIRGLVAEKSGVNKMKIPIGAIFSNLYGLAREDLVEEHIREPTEEEAKIRRGSKVFEFRKTGRSGKKGLDKEDLEGIFGLNLA
ncbi:hypothetical protein GOV14_02780 [Candidatus Pacearchaeota archaeon]|nr:hypothetical protein [Candidatus Pacearchaeota archaeon]